MRTDGMRGLRAATGVAFVAWVGLAASPAAAQVADYLDFGAFTDELRSIVDGSDLASMSSLGASLEGRDIWLVEIADRDGPPLDERPGVMVVGNLSGDHLVGSHLALETLRSLVAPGSDAPLGDVVIYVVPRLNPDGAEAMFASVRAARTRNARPVDDDNDGRTDEDGPDDLNGDGLVTVMRVEDPAGQYVLADDARLLRRAEPEEGESGTHAIYREGLDDDGDGFFNEDGPGGVDLDRNFQHDYPYYEADAGPHMVSEPETRALMDFMVAHRNVAAIVSFGHTDNLVTPPDGRGELATATTLDLIEFADASNAGVFEVGLFDEGSARGSLRLRGAQPGRDNDPSSGRRPAETVNEDDRPYFEAVSEAYREITGIEKVGVGREPTGAFFEWGYYQFGVPSFGTQGWPLPAPDPEAEGEAGEGGAGGHDSVLDALEAGGVDAFVAWEPFDHPQLGPVEVGGYRPYATTNPPAADLPDLGAAHGRFVARLAGMLPRVRVADTEVVAHGGGVFTVRVEIENTGFLPTSLAHGVVCRCVQPTTVQIQVPPEAVLTGSPKTATLPTLAGSGARARFSWVVRGREGDDVEIRVRAQKAGTDTATVTLR